MTFFINSSAVAFSGNGGGYFVGNGGSLTLKNGTSLTGNTATNGGGVYVANGGALTLEGVKVNDIVSFGSYPKTIKSPSVTISSQTADENGYYTGSDGKKYAKRSAQTYDSSYFFSDGQGISNGTEYYFEVEPIKWRVLSITNGQAVLLAEDIVDQHIFYHDRDDISRATPLDMPIYANDYDYSDIRTWLKEDFMNKAFTDSEQEKLVPMDSSPGYGDKVKLLTLDDAKNANYGFKSTTDADSSRLKIATDFSIANGIALPLADDRHGIWWLSDPSYEWGNMAYVVYYTGGEITSFYVDLPRYGVVPEITVKTSDLQTPKISSNTATTGNGHNVYNAGTFTMNGGTIGSSGNSKSGFGIFNTGTMNLYGGTVYDNIYSSATFKIKMNVDMQGTIMLSDDATIIVEDYAGITPKYNILVSSSRQNGVVMTLNGGATAPDVSEINIVGQNTLTRRIIVEKNSSDNWEVKIDYAQYLVSFNPSGGECTEESKVVTFGNVYGDLPTPTRTGYTFNGWFTGLNDGTQVTAETSVSITENHTLFARWSANSYDVSFDVNGGFCSTTNKTVSFDSTYGDLPTPTRVGYTFKGWSKNWLNISTYRWLSFVTISGTQLTFAPETTNTSAHIHFQFWDGKGNLSTSCQSAGWAEGVGHFTGSFTKAEDMNEAWLRLNANKADAIICYNIENLTNGEQYNFSFDILEYDFNRIVLDNIVIEKNADSVETEGNKEIITKTSIVSTPQNHTLFAKWSINDYTFTFDPIGGSLSETSKDLTFGKTYSDLPEPTKLGCVFGGWYAEFNGTSNYINFGRDYMFEDKISIHFSAYSNNWANVASQRLISCTEGGGFNIEGSSAGSDFVIFTGFDKGVGYKSAGSSVKWADLTKGWHSFDMIFDGTYLYGYIDGNLVAKSSAYSSGKMGYNATNSIFVGAEAGSGADSPVGSYFNGKVANFVIQNSSELLSSNNFTTWTVPAQNLTLFAEWDESELDFPTTWKDEIASTENMTTVVDFSDLTSVVFKKTAPTGFVQIGTLSTGLKVFQDSSNSTKIAFVNGKTIYAPVSCSYLFSGMTNLTTLTFDNFDTSKTTEMNKMFFESSGLTSLDLSGFNSGNSTTENVTSTWFMFGSCVALENLDLSGFDTSSVTYMSAMFNDCRSLTSLNLSSFDTSKVEGFDSMFYSCVELRSLDVSSFDTSYAIYMSAMFNNCQSLVALNISSFNTTKANSMYSMFYNCKSLKNLYFGSSFRTTNATDLQYMFSYCSSLTSLDCSGFETTKVTSFERMFQGCSSLINLRLWTSSMPNATTMKYMFGGCSSLSDLKFYSNFSTISVTNMDYMFLGCSDLVVLDLSNLNMESTTSCVQMLDFGSNSKLKRIKTPENITNNVVEITCGSTLYNVMTNEETSVISAGTISSQTLATKFTIIFDTDGGTLSGSQTQITYYGEKIGSLPTPTKKRYSFSGWFYQSNYVSESSVLNQDATLIAHWIADIYTVTLNNNSATTAGTRTIYVQYGVGYFEDSNATKSITSITIPTKIGYTFGGYFSNVLYVFEDIDENGTITASNTAFSQSQSIYAKWIANQYSVTFDPLGGICDTTNKNVSYNGTYGDLPTPTRVGYTFNGWSKNWFDFSYVTSKDSTCTISGQTVTFQTSTNVSTTHVAVDKWKDWTYVSYGDSKGVTGRFYYSFTKTSDFNRVRIKLNGDKVDSGMYIDVSSLTDNHQYFLTFMIDEIEINHIVISNIMIEENSSNQATDFTSEMTTYSTTVSMLSNHTLFAHWTVNNYSATFDANAGSVSETSKDFTYGKTYSDFPIATYTGNEFGGWYAEFNGSSDFINFGREYMFEDKISIHLEAYSDNWADVRYQKLISCTQGGGFNIEGYSCYQSEYIVFTGYDNGVGYVNAISSIKWSELSAGWHTFDMIFDGTYLYGYIDGRIVIISEEFSSGKMGYNATNSIFVGAESGISQTTPEGEYFKGKIGNVVIQNSSDLISKTNVEIWTAPAQNLSLKAKWKMLIFPTSWKSEIASSTYMTTTVNSSSVTEINFNTFIPSGYNQIGTLSTGLKVYQDSTNSTKIAFVSEERIYAPKSCYQIFSGLTNLKTFRFYNFDTSIVTSMSQMFDSCTNLLDIYTGGGAYLDNFNTSNVINMSGMFNQCHYLIYNDLISKLDTSSVTDMSYMFYWCGHIGNLAGFNTSKVTNMMYMFAETSPNTLDLSSFDMSNVNYATNMLAFDDEKCTISLLKTPYNNKMDLEITVKSGHKLFDQETREEVTSVPKNNEKVKIYKDTKPDAPEKVRYFPSTWRDELSELGYYNYSLITSIIFTNSAQSGYSSIGEFSNYLKVYKNSADETKIAFVNSHDIIPENCSELFYGLTKLQSITFGNFVTTNSYDMSKMFYNCYSLTKIDLSGISINNVEYMSYMFSGCSSLTSVKFSDVNSTKLKSAGNMFGGCLSLQELDLRSLNFKYVEDNYNNTLLNGCSTLLKFYPPRNSIEINLDDCGSVGVSFAWYYNETGYYAYGINVNNSFYTSKTSDVVGDDQYYYVYKYGVYGFTSNTGLSNLQVDQLTNTRKIENVSVVNQVEEDQSTLEVLISDEKKKYFIRKNKKIGDDEI